MNAKVKIDKEAEVTPETVRSIAKSVVSKMGPQFTTEQKKDLLKLLVKIFEQGLEPYEAMKLTKDEIAQIYLLAYRLFSSGKFEEAAEAFKMLNILMPLEPGFAVSAGVCYHKLKDYEKAIRFYLLGSFIDKTDPVPLFYAYDCFLNTDDKVSATIMISNALTRCGDDPKYAQLKERGILLLEGLKKEISVKKE